MTGQQTCAVEHCIRSNNMDDQLSDYFKRYNLYLPTFGNFGPCDIDAQLPGLRKLAKKALCRTT
jgi:hypothetical protein